MKVVIDLDGTTYEWEATARWMLRNIRGCTDPALNNESTSWEFISDHVNGNDWRWLWSEGVDLGLFRHGHVTTGAMTGVQKLKEMGHTLIVATSRPPSAMRDTLSWLDHHFGSANPYPWSGIHILSHGEPKSLVNGDLLVDDKPSNAAEWARAGREALLFGRKWNEGWDSTDHITRVDSWKDVVQWISTS